EEEDPAQAKLEPVQRTEGEEEDPAQAKLEPVQRTEGEEEDPAQAKGESSQKVKPIQAKINLAPSGSGKPMPEPVQQKMEGAFGADFSGVRIHEGPQAKAINAIAYTQGENIHFQPGKYQPDTQSGQELLGHELTHVVQQKAGRVTVPQGKGSPINADPGLESEADILGAKAAQGEQVQVTGASSSLQRKELLAHEPTYVVQQSSIPIIQRKLTPEQIKHAKRIRDIRIKQGFDLAPLSREAANKPVANEPVANQKSTKPPESDANQPSEKVIEPAPTANQERENPHLSENESLNQLAVDQPRDYVYKYAENNWFKVKKQFKEGYLHHEESPQQTSKKVPHGMKALLDDRQEIVNKLLGEVKGRALEYEKKKRGEIWEQQFGNIDKMPDDKRGEPVINKANFQAEAKPLIANAPGSTKPSSDIDVNMSGDGSEFAVSWLNEKFREEYGHGNESGQVYDVNFYGKDFVPGEVLFGKTGLKDTGKLNRESVGKGEKEEDKFYAEDKWRNSSITDKNLQKEEMEDQTIASLTMMRVNMEHDKSVWDEYVKKASLDPEMKAILIKVEERYEFRKKTIEAAGTQIKQKAESGEKGYKLESLNNIKDKEYEELKTMSAENLAYENMLAQVETARVKYELLKASNGKTEDIEKAAVELKKIKTQATMFANASYYTEGAVVSIVTNKQMLSRTYKNKEEDFKDGTGKKALKKLELKPQEYYQSFNEQVGFAFHALSKVESVNFYRDIPEPGKYVHRAYSMLRHFYRSLKTPGGELPFVEEQRRAATDWEGVKQGKKRVEDQLEKGYVGKLTDAEKNPTIDRIFLAFGAATDISPEDKIALVKARLMQLKTLADREYINYMQQMFSSPEQSNE
ncbi:DUF4157 domain-containing protein, partial [Microcoleus sp. D3_18a_C4]|uniref:DUF4157 domain-containing protein n=1 Tax=unclassified Microcoleus TaxID=2642155 RepID=UPI002FCFFE00